MTVRRGAGPLLVTQGDPAGIGPELIFQLWERRTELGLPAFAAVGSVKALSRSARLLGHDIPVVGIDEPAEADKLFARGLPVIDHGLDAMAEPGQPRVETAIGTIRAIEHAVDRVRTGRARAIVTNPIAKSVLKAAGFAHPGHTEFLAALSAPGGEPPRPVMMIWSEALAVVPVTIHIPLAEVPLTLTTAAIVETAEIVEHALRHQFGIARPRIAIAGLNPHAGEGGVMGREDIEVVAPAVAEIARRGMDVRGPLPADTMFHQRARASYDVALTMYHDQGLIPAKTLAFDEGVNVTLGLAFIRTSPDHGTAFDIAGKGLARPDSLLAAIRLADRLAARTNPAS